MTLRELLAFMGDGNMARVYVEASIQPPYPFNVPILVVDKFNINDYYGNDIATEKDVRRFDDRRVVRMDNANDSHVMDIYIERKNGDEVYEVKEDRRNAGADDGEHEDALPEQAHEEAEVREPDTEAAGAHSDGEPGRVPGRTGHEDHDERYGDEQRVHEVLGVSERGHEAEGAERGVPGVRHSGCDEALKEHQSNYAFKAYLSVKDKEFPKLVFLSADTSSVPANLVRLPGIFVYTESSFPSEGEAFDIAGKIVDMCSEGDDFMSRRGPTVDHLEDAKRILDDVGSLLSGNNDISKQSYGILVEEAGKAVSRAACCLGTDLGDRNIPF